MTIKDSNSIKLDNGLFFIPIGGSDQIGMNCYLYICDDQILIVDLGIAFAENVPGVDVAIPDLSFVFQRKNKVVGIIITHVHEDHCGALTYLLKYLPEVNIYASLFGINFLKAKLEENGHKQDAVKFSLIEDKKIINIKNFNVEFIQLTHSTLEMMALYIKTKHGTIFHTADWKFDYDPVIGEPVDKERLKALDVDLMVSDSTNIATKGSSGCEGSLYEGLYRICEHAKSRIIVTMFASNVARLSTIFSVAKKLNKKICLAGRALWRVFNAAIESGYLEEYEASLVINEVEINSQKPENLILITTGCQAEETAALTKIVEGKHRHIKFLKNDLIIFSSKNIPGNERRIYNLQNKIVRFGANFITTSEENKVHVSGHPTFDDVKEMYELVRPRIAIPVHGEDIHTSKHASLANDLGVDRVLVVHNGDVIKIDNYEPCLTEKICEVRSGFLYVDGKLFRKESDPVLKTRERIMKNGLILITIFLNKKDKNNLPQIKLSAPGLLDENNDMPIMSDLVNKIKKEIGILCESNDRRGDFYHTTMSLTKKFCRARLGKEPLIKIETIFS
jgi:ribonuclease J